MRHTSLALGGAILLAMTVSGFAQDQTNPAPQNPSGAYGNPPANGPAGQGSPGMQPGGGAGQQGTMNGPGASPQGGKMIPANSERPRSGMNNATRHTMHRLRHRRVPRHRPIRH